MIRRLLREEFERSSRLSNIEGQPLATAMTKLRVKTKPGDMLYGKFIRIRKKNREATWESVAEEIGVPCRVFSRLCGRNVDVSDIPMEQIERVAAFFGKTIYDLVVMKWILVK